MITNNFNNPLSLGTQQPVLKKVDISLDTNTTSASSILNNYSQGKISEVEVITALKELGLTPLRRIENGNIVIEVSINGEIYSGKFPLQTINTTVSSQTSETILDNSVNEYITASVKTSSNFTNLYRKAALINKYGFSENEIEKYFEKHLGLYRLDQAKITADFPGVKISTPEELKTVLECGVNALNNNKTSQEALNELSNQQLSVNDIRANLEDFIVAIKKDLKDKGYSYEYINSVLDFIITKSIESFKETATPKEVGSMILNNIAEILGETELVYMIEKGIGKKKHEVNYFDNSDISANALENRFKKIKKEGNLQAQFLIKIIEDTIQSLNLTDKEGEIFLQRVFDAIGKKIGNYEKGNTKLDFSLLSKLDSNNGSWLDEFHKIIQDEASKINANIDRNPSTIDAKELTNWLGLLSPEKFLENIDDLLLSDDGGVRKFAQMIEDAFGKLGALNQYEQEQLVGYIFKLLNETANRGSSKTLRKASVEKLNNSDLFKKLEDIINSDKLEMLYQFDYDGEIDAFRQGNTGDCWLLSGILSLNATITGRKFLKDALTFNPDNSVTVTFKGVGASYVITPEEILEAQAESERFEGAYSDGDNDVLIFELAVEKLRRDIASGKIDVPDDFRYSNTSENDNGGAGEGITSGYIAQFLYFLTGNETESVYAINLALDANHITNFFNKYYDDFKSGKISLNFSIKGKEHKATTVDGEELNIDLGEENAGHALAIVDMSEDTITIINPWNSEKEYTLTWEEFAKLGVAGLHCTPLK